MESTTDQPVEAPANFSFATASPWTGLDVATMRIHSRARVIQSQHRATRLRRTNTALGILLEAAYAQRMIEEQITRQEQRVIDLREQEINLRERNALLDLAAQGERQSAEAEVVEAPRASLRHLQAIAKMAALEDLPQPDETATPQELDLRDRAALIDLRREHEFNTREALPILRDTQPRSAVANRRWGS